MLNGKVGIDVEELRAYVVYEGGGDGGGGAQGGARTFHELSPVVIWLWRCVRQMSVADKQLFLLFFTGSSRVPLDGFDPPITITE
ncbi:hypothetical protein H4F44_26755, partial [Escherichia coli]|uniref:hypothetical protein n=1 Tax=Escherichia coli TaxID=562 RepID=UPI0019811319